MNRNLFSRVGGIFFEKEEESIDQNFLNELKGMQDIPEVNVEMINEELLTIKNIYEQNNVSDLSKSIFKVDEMKSVLPDNLPNDAKKSSVEGTMKLFGLDKEEVVNDANNRTLILKGVGENIANETIKIIEESQEEIQNLENQINNLKIKITERKKLQENQDKIISDEIVKIDNILIFIK